VAGQGLLDGVSVRVPPRPQSISGDGLIPLLTLQGNRLLLARAPDHPLYILADPDLMNNQGLKDPVAARSALQILSELNTTAADGVDFDLTLNGFGSGHNLLRLPFSPPFLSLTLALFVAALLAGFQGAVRFGPPAAEQRAIAFGKMALVENSAGLIQLVGREHRTGGAYVDLLREEAALAFGAPPGLTTPDLDGYIDRHSRIETPSFSALAQQATAAGNRFELLSAARALFQWKKDNLL